MGEAPRGSPLIVTWAPAGSVAMRTKPSDTTAPGVAVPVWVPPAGAADSLTGATAGERIFQSASRPTQPHHEHDRGPYPYGRPESAGRSGRRRAPGRRGLRGCLCPAVAARAAALAGSCEAAAGRGAGGRSRARNRVERRRTSLAARRRRRRTPGGCRGRRTVASLSALAPGSPSAPPPAGNLDGGSLVRRAWGGAPARRTWPPRRSRARPGASRRAARGGWKRHERLRQLVGGIPARMPLAVGARRASWRMARSWRSCALSDLLLEVVQVEPIAAWIFLASFSADCRSTALRTSSTSATTSPMPRTRPAMRSGSKRSRPPIRSATPMNLIGLPVRGAPTAPRRRARRRRAWSG